MEAPPLIYKRMLEYPAPEFSKSFESQDVVIPDVFLRTRHTNIVLYFAISTIDQIIALLIKNFCVSGP